jgi:tetratricopeptide (TPR) repeat protein
LTPLVAAPGPAFAFQAGAKPAGGQSAAKRTTPPPPANQGQGNVLLEGNEQIFSVLAALNVAGYDTGLGSVPEERTREQVTAELEKTNAAVLPDLQKFYAGHRIANDPGADLGQFISLALLLGPPPDFKTTVPDADLPPDAKALLGFVPLLKSFSQQANLIDLWARVQSRYEAEVARYDEPVRHTVALSDAYLRFPAGSYLGRTYAIYLCLLGAPNDVQARIYGYNYYLVITPSKEPKLNEIRHQYLHFLLDGQALRYAAEINQRSELKIVAHEAPALAADFKDDFPLLVTECLIRAIELHMDKRPKTEVAKSVHDLAASGLILVPYFYDALDEYEKQPASMSVYYKQLIAGINVRDEEDRLTKIKFVQPAAAVQTEATAAPVLPQDRQLIDADNLFYQGKYAEARSGYMVVLEKDPRNARALYGLAVVASNQRKPDLAEDYFKKTLDAARDSRLVTWSHIYLGRLYDLQGKRDMAVSQYKAASLTASAYPTALRAVESGLAAPFGSARQ